MKNNILLVACVLMASIALGQEVKKDSTKFNKALAAELQERVHALFGESLMTYGYLGLGRSETLRFSSLESHYEVVSKKERLYRKIK